MKLLSWCFDRLLDLMGAICGVLLGFAAVAITAEILIRGFNLGSLPWVIEAVEYTLLTVTFLAAPWVLRKSAHVRVDIVVENMPPKVQRVLDLFANAVGIIVCGVIFYLGLKSTIDLYESDTRIFKVLTIKEWWLFSLLPVSCALMIAEFARRIVRGRRVPEDADPSLSEANF